MSANYIRSTYGVPAKRGMRITVDGRAATIVGFERARAYLRIRYDGERRSAPAHPTWNVDYYPEEDPPRS